jgi:hypothetical protein
MYRILDTMSSPLYTPHVEDVRHEEATMSFQEKVTWVSGVVTVIVAAWYVGVVAGPIGEVPVEEIAYRRPLLIAVGAMIGFTILGTIATAIGTAIGGAIGGAIRAEVRGEARSTSSSTTSTEPTSATPTSRRAGIGRRSTSRRR